MHTQWEPGPMGSTGLASRGLPSPPLPGGRVQPCHGLPRSCCCLRPSSRTPPVSSRWAFTLTLHSDRLLLPAYEPAPCRRSVISCPFLECLPGGAGAVPAACGRNE